MRTEYVMKTELEKRADIDKMRIFLCKMEIDDDKGEMTLHREGEVIKCQKMNMWFRNDLNLDLFKEKFYDITKRGIPNELDLSTIEFFNNQKTIYMIFRNDMLRDRNGKPIYEIFELTYSDIESFVQSIA